MLLQNQIYIKGARQNNLKNITLHIPRDKLVVFTGVSGSGKSSLVFHTIYAEGRRRLMESLSAYERGSLRKTDEAEVDLIEGLSPAIAIEQKTVSRNPRSTVGTLTDIGSYLRLLFSRASRAVCPHCQREIPVNKKRTLIRQLMEYPEGTMLEIYSLDDVLIKTFIVQPQQHRSLEAIINTQLEAGEGFMKLGVKRDGMLTFDPELGCSDCGIVAHEAAAGAFSFNTPLGACPTCTGLGRHYYVDPDLVIPDKTKSIGGGAIQLIGWQCEQDKFAKNRKIFEALANRYHFDLFTPVEHLSEEALNAVLYGTDGERILIENPSIGGKPMNERFAGIINIVYERFNSYAKNELSEIKGEDKSVIREQLCPKCAGTRLKSQRLLYRINGQSIHDLSEMPIQELREFCQGLNRMGLSRQEEAVAEPIFREIAARLTFLIEIGLGYLSLSRPVTMLSGGESQRVRLTTQLNSGLMGMIYILDEPTVGLHSRDSGKLLRMLQRLRDLNNTILVIEHDEEFIAGADHIVEIGPGAGVQGGEVVAQGTVGQLKSSPLSLTGQYLSGARVIELPRRHRLQKMDVHSDHIRCLEIIGARENNLKNINVRIPLGCFVGITGVSGSGKSTLVNQVLVKNLRTRFERRASSLPADPNIRGIEWIEDVVYMNQQPIGRNSRSNPATYIGIFDYIRRLFAATAQAKAAKVKENSFSFNTAGGRCEVCSGLGVLVTEMQFMSDIEVVCEACKGQRFKEEILDIAYRGKNIAQVLEMSVAEAVDFFGDQHHIHHKLTLMNRLGMDYLILGQSAVTLSGGEAQRIKLVDELGGAKKGIGKLYILDEPTTGLHFADIQRLLNIFQELVAEGNTVLVIEHNLQLIKTLDYIIDLGPEGGNRGGQIVAAGTVEEVAAVEASYTGQYLRQILG